MSVVETEPQPRYDEQLLDEFGVTPDEAFMLVVFSIEGEEFEALSHAGNSDLLFTVLRAQESKPDPETGRVLIEDHYRGELTDERRQILRGLSLRARELTQPGSSAASDEE